MENIDVLNNIVSRNDCIIVPLSYTSQFGFVFKMIYQNKIEILKLYILADLTEIQNDRPGKRKQKISIDDNQFVLKNYIEFASMDIKVGPFDDEPGYGKRVESRENFMKEATIQKEVYNASINNGKLCPEIHGSYIIDPKNANKFLESLKTKCRAEEGINMIQYLQNNLTSYDLGIIRMEYAEGYTTFRVATQNQTLYENVIYDNIRLLLENGYIHLDLNPGNVMVRDNEVLLIDFGKTKDVIEIIQTFGKKNVEGFKGIQEIVIKPNLTGVDIGTIIEFIIKCEIDYLLDLDTLNRENKGLFHINFVSRLSDTETSYQNIANKLNARINKTISQKYGELLQNTAVTGNSSPINSVFSLFGSDSPQKRRSSLFDVESPPKRMDLSPESKNMLTNLFSFNLGTPSTPPRILSSTPPSTPPRILPRTPPRTPGGGAKKSKKQKRKPLHNKRISKKHKNKSHKKRVKLISNK